MSNDHSIDPNAKKLGLGRSAKRPEPNFLTYGPKTRPEFLALAPH